MSKRQADHTVADILRIKPKWFMAKQSDPDVAMARLSQIHTLIDFGHGKFAEYPFHAVFNGYDISKLQPRDINKALMEYNPSSAAPSSDLVPRITRLSLLGPDELRANLALDRSGLQREIEDLEGRIARHESCITEYHRKINNYLDEIAELERGLASIPEAIEALEARLALPTGLDKEKLAVIRAVPDQWVVVEVTKDTFTIVRREPIILKYSNAASDLCRVLNMGFHYFTLTYNLGVRDAGPVADYIKAARRSAQHPHVSGLAICWGNTAHRADEYVDSNQWGKWFELLESILTTYCPDNPYVKFADFERSKSRGWIGLNENSLKYKTWFKRHRVSLLRMFAESGSDKMREFVAALPASADTDRPAQPKTLRELETYFRSMERIIFGDTNSTLCEELSREPRKGPALRQLLRKHGVYLPSPFILRDIGVSHYDIHSLPYHSLRLMIVAYERGLPTVDGYEVTFGGVSEGRWKVDKGLNYLIRVHVKRSDGGEDDIWDPSIVTVKMEQPEPTPASPFADFRVGQRYFLRSRYDRGDWSLIGEIQGVSDRYVTIRWSDGELSREHDPSDLVRTNLPMPSAETEADDDDCNHEYDSSGNCDHCGEYNEEYDEYREEEDAEDAVPF